MNTRQKFFASGIYCVPVSEPPISKNECDLISPTNQDEASVLCPLNEHGYVSDVLGRALSENVTLQQRDYLLSLLDDKSNSSSYLDVPDDVKLNLCKLRSCQSPSEMKSYIDALSAWCDANNVTSPVDDLSSNDHPSNDSSSNETSSNE